MCNSSNFRIISPQGAPSRSRLTVMTAALVFSGFFAPALQAGAPAPPANDNLASAQVTAFYFTFATGSNVGATKEAGEPAHAGNAGGASVWYSWNCGNTGIATFHTFGSSFDTLLAVYSGTGFPLTLIDEDDDTGPGTSSKVSFHCVAGQNYKIAVDGYNGATGSIKLSWNTFQKSADQFSSNETGTAWVSGGATISDPTLNTVDYDAANGAYRVRVFSNASKYRFPLWYNLKANWLPYSATEFKAVRGKFYVYTTGASSSAAIPNFEMKLSYRFAVTSSLLIQTHDGNANDLPLYQELRPSNSPSMPSIYRVDFCPLEIPYVDTTPGEGVQTGFGAFALLPQDNGYIALTEKQIGTYGIIKTENTSHISSQVYDIPALTHANSVDSSQSFYPTTVVGGFLTPENSVLGTITSHSNGVTFNTTNVPANRIAIMSRLFYAGADLTQRMRVEEEEQYRIRWHVTGARNTSDQAWLWLEHRCAKFGYTQWLQLAGGRTNGTFNNAVARQAIPGIGNQNPDDVGYDGAPETTGGWYTCLMTSPLNVEIRPEGWPGTIQQRMPLLSAQPKRGVNSASARDLRVSAKVYDTISSSGGQEANEAAHFTIDRIEVAAYPLIAD